MRAVLGIESAEFVHLGLEEPFDHLLKPDLVLPPQHPFGFSRISAGGEMLDP
jgi:hypothetical protein